jgi:hypothetical protein
MSTDTTTSTTATAKAAHGALSAIAQRQIKSLDKDEANVRRLDAVAKALCVDVYQVNYYIPSALSDEVDNPSRIFRRHGFRLDGSNWVFPEEGLVHKDVQAVMREWDAVKKEGVVSAWELTHAGQLVEIRVRYWVVKYTREQLAAMREAAQTQLADELIRTHTSLIKRIDDAAKRLEEAQAALAEDAAATDSDKAKAVYSHTGCLRATVNEACERFAMCLKGAELFDDTGSLDSLFGAVRDAIRVQAAAVNATLQARGVKTVTLPAAVAAE